ncbi:MAG: UvrD-helicase domain-containing protein [Anaerococcus sp.]|nr:UvrD-helicase domain-containing protein [Anaerococcus sp.]
MMDLTREQKKAIELRDKNIIVSAAAGSGKTFVLVSRIIDLILKDKVDLSRFIIVTFTNKASLEMKDRIRKSLEKELRKNPEDYKFIKKQIKNLPTAHIQTLHSFAADMLRENFYYFDDLSPNFKVINDSTATILKSLSVDRVFDKAYEKMDEPFQRFLENFATSRSDSLAKDIILSTYEKISSQVDPLGWLDLVSQKPFDLEDFRKEVLKKIEDLMDKARENYNYSQKRSMRDKHIDLMALDLGQIKDLYDLGLSDWDKFIRKISKLKFARISKSKKDDEESYKHIKEVRDNNKEILKEISKFVVNTDSLTVKIFEEKEQILLKEINFLVKEFVRTYDRLKKEKSYLDFSDMEHRFIDLLKIGEAKDKLRDKFKYIFFDEYQDSNEIQNYIIESLKGEDNLFFVGDVKQSIYGFRRASPGLFLNKLKVYDASDKGDRIDLNKNFRSDKDILDFDNYIFDRLMREETSDIDYKDGGHRLNFERCEKKPYKRANIKVLDKDLREEDYLVKLIGQIRTLGYDYKDIAILLRSGAKSYLYEEAFKKAEIPFFNDISKVSFRAVEVGFFINILKYLANPKDDLALLSVIRSEVFGFDEDDLSQIRLKNPSLSFAKAFDLYEGDKDLELRINDFKSNFRDFSYILSLTSLYEFANYIFEHSGLYDFLLARDRASERIENVRAFIDIMDEYDKNNDNSLFGFLTYIETLSLNQADNINTTRDLSESENLVRIMTIHKSKGLEFPVLILADASKRFNNKHLREPIVFDDKLGLGINLSDYENKLRFPSLRKNLINEKISIENKKEEMRILYVALTRAEEMVYITGTRNLNTIDKLYDRKDFLNMSNFLDWILASISNESIASEIFPKASLNNLDDLGSLEVIREIEKIDKYQAKDIKKILEDLSFDPKIYQEYEEIYEKDYPFIEATGQLLKRSVTELAKNFDKSQDGFAPYEPFVFKDDDFRKPDFIKEDRTYSPVELGSIIHRAFEILDLKTYDKDSLEDELLSLSQRGLFDKDKLGLLDFEKILAFFNDPYIKELSKKAKSIRKEESFLMAYKDIYVNGQIDLMVELEDSIILIDFKTDKVKRDGSYDKQIQIYKKALEEARAKPVTRAMIYWYNFKDFEEIKA